MVILVCGGRSYGMPTQQKSLETTRAERWHLVHELATRITLNDMIIAGAAPGADSLAIDWARLAYVPFREFPADWAKYRKRAGFIRNQQMLDEGAPDRVLAFPGNRGTLDMISRARAARIPVTLCISIGVSEELCMEIEK